MCMRAFSLITFYQFKILRYVIKRAFDVWSAVTQLNFTEVRQNGNIKIDFVRGEHGDGFAFDGPGCFFLFFFY